MFLIRFHHSLVPTIFFSLSSLHFTSSSSLTLRLLRFQLLLFHCVIQNWKSFAQYQFETHKKSTKNTNKHDENQIIYFCLRFVSTEWRNKMETSATSIHQIIILMSADRPLNQRNTHKNWLLSKQQTTKNAPLCGNTVNQMQAHRLISGVGRVRAQQ